MYRDDRCPTTSVSWHQALPKLSPKHPPSRSVRLQRAQPWTVIIPLFIGSARKGVPEAAPSVLCTNVQANSTKATMRWSLRFALSASILVILILFLLKNKLEDFWDQYDVTSYIGASWQNTFQHGTVENIPTFSGQHGDKVIIMAKLEKENTDWVAKELPEYASTILTPNPSSALTNSQLASSNLHREPHPQHHNNSPHNPPKQRPRSNGLPLLHNRQLRLPPHNPNIPPPPPLRLPLSLAHRCPPSRQRRCSPRPQDHFRTEKWICKFAL